MLVAFIDEKTQAHLPVSEEDALEAGEFEAIRIQAMHSSSADNSDEEEA